MRQPNMDRPPIRYPGESPRKPNSVTFDELEQRREEHRKRVEDLGLIQKQYGYKLQWWKSEDPLEMAYGQLCTGVLFISRPQFYEALEKVLGRKIDWDKIESYMPFKEEIEKLFPPERLASIIRKG